MSLDDEDKQWIREQVRSALKESLNEHQALTDRLIQDVHSDLDTKMERLNRELREEMRNGFQQVNARLIRVDLVWKVARDWGRDMDDHEIKTDAVIARFEKQLGSFEERLARMEREMGDEK